MFTGIVEGLGTVISRTDGDVTKLTIALPHCTLGSFASGASLAVDGCCLTVVDQQEQQIAVEIGAETKAKTTLGSLQVGDKVNLERPLLASTTASGRVDGHFVLGHVDTVGHIVKHWRDQDLVYLRIAIPTAYSSLIIYKGSVAVDGISLTVNQADQSAFEVALLPFTCDKTTLGNKRQDDPVNLEFDMLGKYIVRYLGIQKGEKQAHP